MTSRSEKSDEQLLLDLAQEDRAAMDELYRRHASRVLGYGLKRGLSRERAEEVTQIVFLQLYRKRHLYRDEHPALAWIYVITKSELRDDNARENKGLAGRVPFDEKNLSQSAASLPNTDERAEARALLESLPEREREALSARYLRDEDFDEIARRLRTSAGNVRQLVSRALKKLRGQS